MPSLLPAIPPRRSLRSKPEEQLLPLAHIYEYRRAEDGHSLHRSADFDQKGFEIGLYTQRKSSQISLKCTKNT